MKKKRWAKISVFVGILGGLLALFFICAFLAAGIGASRSGVEESLSLLVTTFGIIFLVALKSACYYKKDERVNSVMVKLFAASSAVGFFVSLLLALANIPMVSGGLIDGIIDVLFDGSDGFERALGFMFLSAILSVAWGIYYAICLRKFEN
ncbi:hypothetical protein QM415_05610 [Streptococcus peroris]|uniref:hypothetical protein n=1 Tax=Streptococcus peroris TaxID=68891 RepID=UPI0039C3784E